MSLMKVLDQRSMRLVAIGLSLIYWGILLILVAFFIVIAITGVVLAMVRGLIPEPENPETLVDIAKILVDIAGVAVALMFVFYALTMVGKALCLYMPRESGVRGFALSVLGMDVVCFMFAGTKLVGLEDDLIRLIGQRRESQFQLESALKGPNIVAEAHLRPQFGQPSDTVSSPTRSPGATVGLSNSAIAAATPTECRCGT